MRYNIVVYDAVDVPVVVLMGEEEVLTHDLPNYMPPGGTWRNVTDIRNIRDAPAITGLPVPDGAPR